MNYIELKITNPGDQEKTDILIAEMAEKGFESFVEEDDHLLAYIPQKDYSAEMLLKIDAFQDLDEEQVSFTVIEDQNWNAMWESNYPPVKIANRCFIHAPFHKPDPEADFNILVKPKMAFGTAHHETTAMMVELLLDEPVSGKRVLDMGCGTGVLAILAALKGAKDVTAIDNDEWAYQNALENAALNTVDFIDIDLGDGSLLKGKKGFDLILANINKNILLNDMKVYAKALNANGKIIFSGFYTEDLEDIRKDAKPNGMNFVSHISRNNWVAAIFIKQ